jgi:hypothetical protein
MATALLTGSKYRTARLGGALRARLDDVVVADCRDDVAALAARLPQRSIGAYVQLLMDADAGPAWAPPVTERIEAVALVAPLLTPTAEVVLVADDPADPAHDQRVADGLCLLAEAALGRSHPGGVTITVVQDGSPEAISRALRVEPTGAGLPPLADLGADLDYADWRTDILNLTSTIEGTYFGWVNGTGAPRVGLLRGSVLSPLAVPLDGAVGWGHTEPAAEALAGALIADTLGGTPVDDDVIAGFVKDVVGSLPESGFELPAAEIRRWLHDHLRQPFTA